MPEWKPEILRRLAPLNLAPTREAEIADELSQHLEDRFQELLDNGQSEDAAFRTAFDELKGEDLAQSLKPQENEADGGHQNEQNWLDWAGDCLVQRS